MARLSGLCIFALLLASSVAQITFTGNAAVDFNPNVLSADVLKTFVQVNNTASLVVGDYPGRKSGFDIAALYFQYDYKTDTLHVGIDCWGVCGDADGDGDPSVSTTYPILDFPRLDGSEAFFIGLMTNLPPNWAPSTNSLNEYIGYRPDVVFTDSLLTTEDFSGYSLDWNERCKNKGGIGSSECDNLVKTTLESGVNSLVDDPDKKIHLQNPNIKPLALFNFPEGPTSALPDIEFSVYNLSRYGSFNFVPGAAPITLAFNAYAGSFNDKSGEDRQPPLILEIPCFIRDSCGVCGGNNSTCLDCRGVANGGWKKDQCNDCKDPAAANWNSACKDCAGIVNGNTKVDVCGRCGGDGEWCKDCAGIIHGTTKKDICGICGGNGTLCLDCEGVPFGGKVYDLCGVCDGDNTACDCYFETPLTFYPEDTWVELNDRLASHCDDQTLEVKNNRSRALLQFEQVTQSILQAHKKEAPNVKTVILNATLHLSIKHIGCGWEDPEFAVHRIEEFQCATATWDCSAVDKDGCCSQWRMIGLPPQVEASYKAETSGLANLHNGQTGELVFDILEEVTAHVDAGDQHPITYILKKVCEHDSGCASFWSSEAGSLSPRIEVLLKTKCPVRPKPPVAGDPCPDPQRDLGDWKDW